MQNSAYLHAFFGYADHDKGIKKAATLCVTALFLAERKRFELSKPFRGLYAFQAYLFNHSSTSPLFY